MFVRVCMCMWLPHLSVHDAGLQDPRTVVQPYIVIDRMDVSRQESGS